jgi:hypothetical protein
MMGVSQSHIGHILNGERWKGLVAALEAAQNAAFSPKTPDSAENSA